MAAPSPGGTDDEPASFRPSLRDLGELLTLFPPMNRWAILAGPSGTEDDDLNHRQAIFVKRSGVKKAHS